MRKTKQFSFKSFYLATTRARIIVFCLCMCVFFVLHLFGCCFESIPEVISIFIIRRYGGQTEVFWLKRQMALNSREKRCKFAFPFFSVCNLVSCVLIPGLVPSLLFQNNLGHLYFSHKTFSIPFDVMVDV